MKSTQDVELDKLYAETMKTVAKAFLYLVYSLVDSRIPLQS